MQPLRNAQFNTTILIVAPHGVQAIAVPILRRYSPDVLLKVPAHFTVMYPFVPVDSLPDACKKVRTVCADIRPFDVTVNGYDSFPGVAYIKAEDPEPIRAVFRARR